MSLLQCPAEILLSIAESLILKDLNSFLRTSQRLKTILAPLLHTLAIRGRSSGIPAICSASARGQESLVRLLLQLGQKPRNIQLALFYATICGKVNVVKLLLADGGADVNSWNRKGATPLSFAVANGDTAMVRVLLENGADTETQNSQGQTLLFLAVCHALDHEGSSGEIIKLLLERGASFDPDNEGKSTALHQVSSHQLGPDIAELLLRNGAGADVNSGDDSGMTPLHLAATGEYKRVIELLLRYGADINAQDCSGATALHRLHLRLSYLLPIHRVAAFLLDRGASLDIQDIDGRTALHVATEYGDSETVLTLIQRGADITIRDSSGRVACDYAGYGGLWQR